jgi:hypothetical protein
MDVIDDEGRLFGVVNVVDALVGRFLLAIVAAGVALVLGGGGAAPAGPTPTPSPTPTATPLGHQATQTVTLDLGTHPRYVASLVEPGNATLAGANATITDVYRSPRGENVLLVATAHVEGRAAEDGFRVGDTYLRYGVGATLVTDQYQINSRVATVGGSETIPTEEVTATVEANVSHGVADSIEVGDTQRLAGESVATVEGVETVEKGEDWAVVRVDLTLVTRPVDDQFEYGGHPVRVGTGLGFATSRYQFSGRVVAVES